MNDRSLEEPVDDGAFGLPGGPAFPISIPGCGDNGCTGMSLRDYFAGQAVAGLLTYYGLDDENEFATDAYKIADAMLRARKS